MFVRREQTIQITLKRAMAMKKKAVKSVLDDYVCLL
jgi:hypothetical protein